MKKKYKIGITFNLEGEVKDIWANGVSQNVVFLYQLFKASKIVDEVVLVCWGPDKITSPDPKFMLDRLDLKFCYIDDVIDELDVLIEGTLIIDPNYYDRMKAHGGKLVCYKMGNDYVMDIEAFLFEKTSGHTFNGTKFDSCWIIPQNMNTNASYCSIMYHSESRLIPFIWAPTFCDKVINRIKAEHNIEFGYLANVDRSSQARRISSFESNISIFKNCFTDILVAEQAYRTEPELIKHVYMCNTYDKRNNPTFFNFIGRTALVRDGVMSVEGRYQMPDFLSRYTDVVLSTQWENGLNYAYNDALYGGYPFIHNSKLLPKGVGYYYEGFDAFHGADVLLNVIKHHDKNHTAYVKRANDYLRTLSPTNPINVTIYESELKRLFE